MDGGRGCADRRVRSPGRSVSDASYFPRTVYFPLDTEEWLAFHRVLGDAELPERLRRDLSAALEAIQVRAETHFAMVVWSYADVQNAAARLGGDDVDEGDEVEPALLRLSAAEVEDIAWGAADAMIEAMVPHAWDVLEDYVTTYLPARPG